jgi:diamine N-acetyltransferase
VKTSIALATKADLADLIDVGRRTFIETYKGTGNRPEGLEETYAHETFTEEKLAPELAKHLIARADGRVAGYGRVDFEPLPACVPDRNSARIAQLYLLKEFQGLGLGARLFKEASALARSRGATGLWLGVWDQNKRAISFYETLGFRRVGETSWKFQYASLDYEDTDWIMALSPLG